MTVRRVVAITGSVIALAALVLVTAGRGVGDALALAVAPGCAALAVGGIGAVILDRLRHRSFSEQVTTVALIAVATAAAGELTAMTMMAFAADQLLALSVTLMVAAAVAVTTALALAQRMMRAAELLRVAARQIDADSAPVTAPVEIRELAGVGDELERAAARVGAERARRELVSWVSHDLRSPLAGIRAIADALADGMIDNDITVHVRRLRMETDRLTSLIDDLAQLNRVETGELQLEFEEVSLSDIVSDVLAATEAVAESKGVKLEGHVLSAPHPVELAAKEIGRVLANLFDNAVRATPRGGTVSVEVDMDEDAAIVVVTDECGGFPDDQHDRSRSGLGLVIAHGFVKAHGGELSMDDHAAGCRHILRLPHAGHGAHAGREGETRAAGRSAPDHGG